ncbi:MAG: hypothetical protein J1F23_05645 [Oscillospiraceae bacterium]|nr:hypothetical protein [Oscillospiraceae bacterium]
MKNSDKDIPIYLRDLSRDEIALIVQFRMCSLEQKKEISKHLKECVKETNKQNKS